MAASLLSPAKRNRTGIIAVIGLVVVGIAAFLAVLGFVRGERERELGQWQLRLDWWAQQSAESADRWLRDQRALADRLAANDTIRLQLTLMAEAGSDGGGLAAEEVAYVRNLLQAVSLNAGLRISDSERRVPANIPQFAPEGVALIANGQRLVAATAGMPTLDQKAETLLAAREAGGTLVVALDPAPDGVLRVLLASPVYRFQADPSPADEIGMIVMLRSLSRAAALELINPGSLTAPGSKAGVLHLITSNGSNGRLLLSTRADTDTGLSEGDSFSLDNQKFFLARAATQPGVFLETETLSGDALLISSAKVELLPWLTAASIRRDAALAASEARLDTLATLFFGGILVATLLILLFWRHGASAKAEALSDRMARTLDDERRARTLLQGVSDAITDELLALDRKGLLLYANESLALRVGVSADEMKRKTLAAILGPAVGAELNAQIEKAHAEGTTVRHEMSGNEEASAQRVIRAIIVPVGPHDHTADNDTSAASEESEPATILVLQDITEPLRSREALAEAETRMVRALVRIINQRDPFAAEQSAQASRLAEELAEEMGLPPEEVRAANQAALLIDLGKIAIPRDLLTKKSALTAEELQFMRRAIRQGVELVDNAGLPSVVYKTLRQLADRLGAEKRPVDLAEDELLMATKVAAIAHHFVALASKRVYREGFSLEDALRMVREDSDLKHDDAVVSALSHLYYSRGGRERWHLGSSGEKEQESES